MEHGMNCPHHADKDEACTCALTERTMHAAWRKRAEEAEARIAALESQVKALTDGKPAACDPMKCNPTCLRCGDTPSCGDGSWSWMDGVHRHRCRDLHPQCGHDRVPCEKHQPGELIALLRDEVKALRITRDAKNAEVDRLTAERDAQAEAVRVLGEECREWRKIKWTPEAFSRFACVYRRHGTDDALDMTARATEANPIARAAVEKGGGQ